MESLIGHILSQYLGDYFSNFSREKFSMSVLQGIISVNDLIFKTTINDRLKFPFKLKYGQLGQLEIKLQSYMNIAKGMSCKISEVFLCFEMLEMKDWQKETVIQKYQQSKRFHLDNFEKQLGIVHGELKKSKREVNSETMQQIIANLKIEVEKICIMFEDEDLKFSIGLLLPSIKCLSTSDDFNAVRGQIEDVAVLFKKMQVSDVSAFINTSNSFQSLDQTLQLPVKIQTYMKLMSPNQAKDLCQKVKDFLRATFEDSEGRFSQESSNEYLFRDKQFSIDCRLKYVQDLMSAMRSAAQRGEEFSKPLIDIDLIFGGLFKDQRAEGTEQQESLISIKKVITEEQLYVALHILTFLSAYENFSQGVIHEEFLSQEDSVSESTKNRYQKLYLEYLSYRAEGLNDKNYETRLTQKLQGLVEVEDPLPIDTIIKMRFIISELFFGEVKIREQFQTEMQRIQNPLSSGFSIFAAASSDNAHQNEMTSRANFSMERDLRLLRELSAKKLERLGKSHSEHSDGELNQLRQRIQMTTEQEEEKLELSWFRLKLQLPKLSVVVHAKKSSDQNESGPLKRAKTRRFQAHSLEKMPKLCVISLEGLRIDFESKSAPYLSRLSVSMDSLSVQDPNVISEVRLMNPTVLFRKENEPCDFIMKTVHQNHSLVNQPVADQKAHRLAQNQSAAPQGLPISGEKAKLFSLLVETVEMEQYVMSKKLEQGTVAKISEIPSDRRNTEDIENPESSRGQGAISEDQQSRGDLSDRSQPAGTPKQEYHTSANLDCRGNIILFSNFFFMKKMFKMITAIAQDMAKKRQKLIAKVNSVEVLKNITLGFNYVQQLKEMAYKRMEALRQEHLLRQSGYIELGMALGNAEDEILSPQSIYVNIASPKIIFDEYLFGQPVMDSQLPALFLLDMGSWVFETKVYSKSVECHSDYVCEGGLAQDHVLSRAERCQQGTYESLDMKFQHLSMHYTPISSQVFLDRLRLQKEAFKVFKDLNLGIQLMTLLKQSQEEALIPSYLINVLFDELKLNFDRRVVCQLLKVQTFLNYGTWNLDLQQMYEAIANVNDYSQAKLHRMTIAQEVAAVNPQKGPASQFTKVAAKNLTGELQERPEFRARLRSDSIRRRDETILQEKPATRKSQTKRAIEDVVGTGSRINLIFNKFSLTHQTVSWDCESDYQKQQKTKFGMASIFDTLAWSHKSDLTNKVKQLKTALKQFTLKKDFQLGMKSLKIACNFPQFAEGSKSSIMDALIFLSAVTVKDRAHPGWHHRSLLLYDDKKANLEKPSSAGPHEESVERNQTVIKSKPAPRRSDLLTNPALKVNPLSKSAKESRHHLGSSLRQQVKGRAMWKAMKVFSFAVFDRFLALKKYQKEKAQFAIRLQTESTTTKERDDRREEREKVVTQGKKQIKVGKLKLVAVFNLLERLLQMTYNTVHDLSSVDLEFQEHIKRQKKRQAVSRADSGRAVYEMQPQREANLRKEEFRVGQTIRDQKIRATDLKHIASSVNGRKISVLENLKAMRAAHQVKGDSSDGDEMDVDRRLSPGGKATQNKTKNAADQNQKVVDQQMTPQELSLSLSLSDESQKDSTFKEILKLVREAWEAKTEFTMTEMSVIVPSDLENSQSVSLIISTGLSMSVFQAQESVVTYDVQNPKQPNNVSQEVFTTDSKQIITLKNLSLFLHKTKEIDNDSGSERRSSKRHSQGRRRTGPRQTARSFLLDENRQQQKINYVLRPLGFSLEQIWKTSENSAIATKFSATGASEVQLIDEDARQGLELSEQGSAKKITEKDQEYKQLGFSVMRTVFHDQLVLTIDLENVRPFINLLQLILQSNNRILKLEAQPLIEFTKRKAQATESKQLRTKVALKSPLNVKAQDLVSPRSTMSFSVRSEGSRNVLPESSVNMFEVSQNSQVRGLEKPRESLKNLNLANDSDGLPDVTERSSSFSYNRIGEDMNEDRSIDDIVKIHSRNQGVASKPLSRIKDTEKTLIYAVMTVVCEKGLRIAFDDEFTADYEENVLGIAAKEFSLNSCYLSSNVTDKFRAHQQFAEDRQVMLSLLKSIWLPDQGVPYPLLSSLVTYSQCLQMNFEVMYFNKKTFCLEPLIEPFRLTFSNAQERPLDTLETQLSSPDMLEINLTYGCIVSIQETLDLIRKDEAEMALDLAVEREAVASHPVFKSSSTLLKKQSKANFKKSNSKHERGVNKAPPTSGKSEAIAPQAASNKNLQVARPVIKLGTADETKAEPEADASEEAEELVRERKKFIKKLDVVNNSGKPFEVWFTNEQVRKTDSEQAKFNDNFRVELKPNMSFKFDQDRGFAKSVLKLFASYKPEEVANAEMFMHVRAGGSGEFKQIWNIQVYQTGMLSFKLKKLSRRWQSQYFMLNTTRTANQTSVTFESIAVLYNKLEFDLMLSAYSRGPHEGRFKMVDQVCVEKRQVRVIPISWFESQCQVRVTHFDANSQEQKRATENVILGNIKKVLNPNITEPTNSFAQQIRIKGQWVAFEVALLTTRSHLFGQFVMTLNYVCKFHNLMMTPIQIVPKAIEQKPLPQSKELPVDVLKQPKSANSDHQSFVSESLSGSSLQSHSSAEPGYCLFSNERLYAPALNIEKAAQQDSEFMLELKLRPGLRYQATINYLQLQRMKANKTIGFQNGIIVDLKRTAQSSDEGRDEGALALPVISVVLEKIARPGSLKNNNYNAFTLRKKLFYHQCSYLIEIYAPLMAVNLTKNQLRIFDQPRQGVSRTSVELPPERSSYINLHLNSKRKLFMQAVGFQVSQAFSLQEVGMQNVIKMNENFVKNPQMPHEQNKQRKQALKKIELGTMISHGPAPYDKTKILRIVQRTVLINQLRRTVVFKEPYSETETALDPGCSIDYDFLASNQRNSLLVRLVAPMRDNGSRHNDSDEFEEEKEGGGKKVSPGYTSQLTNKDYSLTQTSSQHLYVLPKDRRKWSYLFHTENIGDFQITLPQSAANQSWSHQSTKLFVRVSITQDLTDDSKLIVVLSKPLQPEFFCINHTPYKLFVWQKEPDKEVNDTYELKPGSPQSPVGLPIVLNPALPKSVDILYVQMVRKGKRVPVVIDKNGIVSKVFENERKLEIQTRKSGSCWLLEVFERVRGVQLDENNACDDQQRVWFDRIMSSALGRSSCDDKGAPDKGVRKYDIAKSMTIVKLGGLAISMVDYNPQEFCYFAMEGIVFLQEYNVYKDERREKTFTKLETSIRNLQLDDCVSLAVPIVLGSKIPFRNIERNFLARNGIAKQDFEKHFVRAWVCMSVETDGAINTKTIEDVQVELVDTEINLQVTLLGKLQEFSDSLSRLQQSFEFLGNSALTYNLGYLNKLLMMEDAGILFEQVNLIHSVFNEIDRLRAREDKGEKFYQSQTLLENGAEFARPSDFVKLLDSVKKENYAGMGQEEACSDGLEGVASGKRVMYLNKMFVENIAIKQIKVGLSFRMRGIERVLKKRGGLGFLLNFGSNFGDITGAEFVFPNLELAGLNETQETITGQLVKHYKSAAITQFYQLATQQDILGNPGSFIKNLAKAGVEAKSAPFDAFIASDPSKKGVRGCVGGLKSLAGNTTLAVTTSYSGLSGSVYLGLRNLCNARLTHQDMDRPLSISGGMIKGGKGFGLELWYGVSGLYTLPRKRVLRQGVGAAPIAKGIGQGFLQFLASPITATLRATYDLSSGVKNQIQGYKMRGQRFRHPRFINNDLKMDKYDPVLSHAATALKECKEGKYSGEKISYALDLTYMTARKRLVERVVLITNESIMMIVDLKHLSTRILLRKIRGTMLYYYDHRDDARSSVNMELEGGKVVRLHTSQPQKNAEFVKELRRQLEQLEKLDKQNQNEKLMRDKQIEMSEQQSRESQGNQDVGKDYPELDQEQVYHIYEDFSFEFEPEEDDQILNDEGKV